MSAATAAYVVAAGLAVSVLVAVAAGHLLRRGRLAREASGEHAATPAQRTVVDDPEHLGDPAVLAALDVGRGWLEEGARVVHDEFGLGRVIAVGLPHIGVHFDTGAGRWVPPASLDPITADDEQLLALIRDQRPTLPNPRDPAQED